MLFLKINPKVVKLYEIFLSKPFKNSPIWSRWIWGKLKLPISLLLTKRLFTIIAELSFEKAPNLIGAVQYWIKVDVKCFTICIKMFWQCTKLLILPPHIPWKGQGGGLPFLHYSIIDLNGSGENRSICLKMLPIVGSRLASGTWKLKAASKLASGRLSKLIRVKVFSSFGREKSNKSFTFLVCLNPPLFSAIYRR